MVERFNWQPDGMIDASTGTFVYHSNYAALKAENERLTVERDDALVVKREAIAGWKEAESALAERAGGVKVKALEWEEKPGLSTAQTETGVHYSVWDSADIWVCNLLDGVFASREAAKAAAQADYERRILSAITTEPTAPATKVWQLPTVDKTLAEMLVIATGGEDDEGADDEWLPEQRARVDLWQASIRDALSAAPEGQQEAVDIDNRAREAADAVGVTPYSDMRPFVEQAVKYALTRPAEQAVTDEMVEAAAEVIWNDRDARMGGTWRGRGRNEVVVVATLATARAALTAALAQKEEGR